MIENKLNYESYLLRLWQIRQNGKTIWRASLESTRTGVRENFADLKQAFAFLRGSLPSERAKMLRRRKKSNKI
ncbi:MAG: hypothetical protein L0Y55_01930 [Anaerolineales bacterium]|nr:hypothetical protein [Anaerolineales bacterium]